METKLKYYSQFKQDQLLAEYFFRNQNEGFFLDIGASDGVHLSNSYFFEKEHSWNGICFEPRQKAFEQLKEVRSCHVYNCALGQKEEEVLFMEAGLLSGLTREYEPHHLKRIEEHYKDKQDQVSTYYIKLRNLMSILEEQKVQKVDFICIDTEGGEVDILASLDYEKVEVDVIVVEDNYHGFKPLKELLIPHGFTFCFQVHCDGFFVHERKLPEVLKSWISQVNPEHNFPFR